MITGENPQDVANKLGPNTDDMKPVNYLRSSGYTVEIIVDGGTKETDWSFTPSNDDFDTMAAAIEAGKSVLYHFAGWDGLSQGHYALAVAIAGNDFIFWDPAGDRIKGYFNNSGRGAVYTRHQLRAAGIKRLWSVEG